MTWLSYEIYLPRHPLTWLNNQGQAIHIKGLGYKPRRVILGVIVLTLYSALFHAAPRGSSTPARGRVLDAQGKPAMVQDQQETPLHARPGTRSTHRPTLAEVRRPRLPRKRAQVSEWSLLESRNFAQRGCRPYSDDTKGFLGAGDGNRTGGAQLGNQSVV